MQRFFRGGHRSAAVRKHRVAALGRAAAIGVVASLLTILTFASAAGAKTAQYITCKDPSQAGALHTSGNQVLDNQDKRFTFYGISVYGGLATYGPSSKIAKAATAAQAQIEAAPHWHANTVRVPADESSLFINGVPTDGVNLHFLQRICTEVQLIRKNGMEAVITDQTDRGAPEELNPMARTEDFWKVISEVFKNQPGVMFDLFNEPRLLHIAPTSADPDPTTSADWVWQIWQQGGDNGGYTYIGMQALINEIRALGSNNLIWVEGPFVDDSLGQEQSYPVTGTNLVWEVHHPLLRSPAYWEKYFGYISNTYPMVDGEWAQYEAPWPECQSNAYSIIPTYLKYLRAHNIGMLGWSLQPGSMVADPEHITPNYSWKPSDPDNPKLLWAPSTMNSSYKCVSTSQPQGDGRLLMDYFTKYSTGPFK